MYTLLIHQPDGENETLYGLDSVGVLARTNTLRMDLPTAEFARLLIGEQVRRNGYTLKVRNERNDSIALDRITEAIANPTADTLERVSQLVEWVRPGFRDVGTDELSEAEQARIREVAEQVRPA